MIIRPETAADRDAIRKVNDEAFGGPLEAKLVDALATYDPAFRGCASYPAETFGIAY